MAIISIDYDEGSKEEGLGYKSVKLHLSSTEEKFIFDSGDFVKDWYNATKKFLEFPESHCMFSSSVDHFIMDGAEFDSAWVMLDNEMKAYLVYEYNERGMEVFVKKGTKLTWEELKKYVKGE